MQPEIILTKDKVKITLVAGDVPPAYAKQVEKLVKEYNNESDVEKTFNMIAQMPSMLETLKSNLVPSGDDADGKYQSARDFMNGLCDAVANGSITAKDAISTMGLSSTIEMRYLRACAILQAFASMPCNSKLKQSDRTFIEEEPSCEDGFWSLQLTNAVIDAASRFCGHLGFTLATYSGV